MNPVRPMAKVMEMFNRMNNKVKVKGSALLFVLVMLMIVTLLANVVLQVMLNQSRLSQHRIWRVQALYEAQAAMVLTMQQLRDRNWDYSSNYCLNACPPNMAGPVPIPTNDELIYDIGIGIGALGSGPNNTARIDITVAYQRAGTF
ncbi:MAG: hypothetical protein ABIH18_05135 [Candidatus Omnitrophota bacterium]